MSGEGGFESLVRFDPYTAFPLIGECTTTLTIWVPCLAPQTCLVDEFVILLVAKGEADPLLVPPFSPGFFARGQLSPLRNILAANDLRSLTTDIENYGPVVLFGAEPACHGTPNRAFE